MAVIHGTKNGDDLIGTAQRDWIAGYGGDDHIEGAGGDDTIYGNDGRDRLSGGASNDRLSGGWNDDELDGGAGEDVLKGGAGNDKLFAGGDDDLLFGGRGADVLRGGANADRLFGGDGTDYLYGGEGDDLLWGGAGRDGFWAYFDRGGTLMQQETEVGHDVVMDFVQGEDFLHPEIHTYNGEEPGWGFVGFATLDTNGNGVLDNSDAFVAIRQVDAGGISKLSTVIDLAGALESQHFSVGAPFSQTFTIHGVTGLNSDDFELPGFREIPGTDQDDVIQGIRLDEAIAGKAGNDRLHGGGGDDFLTGGAGNDRLDEGTGDGRLEGGDGSDLLQGGAGDDHIFGDRLGYDIRPVGEPTDDRLFGGAGDDFLSSGMGSDVMTGGDGRDIFSAFGFGEVLDDGKQTYVDILVTDFTRGEDFLNSETIPFTTYDTNGDGRIRADDPGVSLEQVNWQGETRASLVLDLFMFEATARSGTITLFGVSALMATDFNAGGFE